MAKPDLSKRVGVDLTRPAHRFKVGWVFVVILFLIAAIFFLVINQSKWLGEEDVSEMAQQRITALEAKVALLEAQKAALVEENSDFAEANAMLLKENAKLAAELATIETENSELLAELAELKAQASGDEVEEAVILIPPPRPDGLQPATEATKPAQPATTEGRSATRRFDTPEVRRLIAIRQATASNLNAPCDGASKEKPRC